MYDETIDSRIYDRLYQRLNLFERTLGGLEAMLGSEIRRLTDDLLRDALTPEQERSRIDQTAHALVTLRQEEERLEQEAPNLVAYGDYILTHVKAARELNRWISGEDIRNYVVEFFREYYPGSRFDQRPSDRYPLTYEVALTTDAKYELQRFVEAKGLVGKTGLVNPNSTPVRCIFENKMAIEGVGRAEVVSQVHPVVRFVGLRLTEKWSGQFPPLAVRVRKSHCPQGIDPGTYVFLMQRWAVAGVQDKEVLFSTTLMLNEPQRRLADSASEQLLLAAAHNGVDWPEARGEVDLHLASRLIVDACTPYAEEQYAAFVRQVADENSDRANLQRQSIDRHYRRQLEVKQRIREEHLRKGRRNLIPAIDGQLKQLEALTAMRLRKIDEGVIPRPRCDEVCVGVILAET